VKRKRQYTLPIILGEINDSLKLRDVQEYVEAPRSTFREIKPMNNFLNYMALMKNIIYFLFYFYQEAANQ
jgi:hypothetical protein